MPTLYDANGVELKPRADIIATGSLGAVAAEVVLDMTGPNGGVNTISFDLRGPGLNLAVIFEGSIDGTNFDQPLPAINQLTQAMVNNPTVTAAVRYIVPQVAGFQKVRIRCTAFTAGPLAVVARASQAIHAVQAILKPSDLSATQTGAAGAAVTLSLAAAGVGLYHYITRLSIQRSASAALIAAAAPVLVTTSNLPGAPVFQIPADAAPQGSQYTEILEPTTPIKSSAANTATTVVMPITTGAIWRATAHYYVGA
jgi:disulfide bond formation protein DsbB